MRADAQAGGNFLFIFDRSPQKIRNDFHILVETFRNNGGFPRPSVR
jgi:hypothetical protein